MDHLWATRPSTTLHTSGRYVGLPDGLMGNSEVGHLNIGAGRVVMQAMTQIDERVRTGDFSKNPEITRCLNRLLGTDRTLHLMGLVSDGGVHSWPGHYEGLLKTAAESGLKPDQVAVHAFTDGRDTPPRSGLAAVHALRDMIDAVGVGRIASVCGRYFAMDRDHRWDRTQKAYDLLTQGVGELFPDAPAAVSAAYERGETDEFIEPALIGAAGGSGPIRDGDSILFFNFRGDRPRQLTRAFTDDDFDGFERSARPKVHYTTLTRYQESLPVDGVAYSPAALSQNMPDICGETLSKAGVRQLRIAETEKYPHVTFFFNGQEEKPFEGEERIMVPSPKVATYDLQPSMSAPEITDRFVEAFSGGSFQAAVCNFANADMVGHTGILEAAIEAVTTVDTCLGRCLQAVETLGGSAIVTADHGNAEQMLHEETGEPHTAHTTNPVPCVVVDPHFSGSLREGGALCDLSPTMLAMLNVEKPVPMTGSDLRNT